MKKHLLSLLCLLVFALPGLADTYSLVMSEQGWSNAQKITSVGNNDITIQFVKNSGIDPAYYTSGSNLRIYGGNAITFTPKQNVTITEVKFTVTSEKYNNLSKVSIGNLTKPSKTEAKWEGEATSAFTINNDNSSQTRIKSLIVTYTSNSLPITCTPPYFQYCA